MFDKYIHMATANTIFQSWSQCWSNAFTLQQQIARISLESNVGQKHSYDISKQQRLALKAMFYKYSHITAPNRKFQVLLQRWTHAFIWQQQTECISLTSNVWQIHSYGNCKILYYISVLIAMLVTCIHKTAPNSKYQPYKAMFDKYIHMATANTIFQSWSQCWTHAFIWQHQTVSISLTSNI